MQSIPYDPMQTERPGNGADDAVKKLQEAIDQIHLLEEIIEKYRKVKEGHWIVLDNCSNEGIYCSHCNNKIFDYPSKPKKKLSNYCPNCGSKNEQFYNPSTGKYMIR